MPIEMGTNGAVTSITELPEEKKLVADMVVTLVALDSFGLDKKESIIVLLKHE